MISKHTSPAFTFMFGYIVAVLPLLAIGFTLQKLMHSGPYQPICVFLAVARKVQTTKFSTKKKKKYGGLSHQKSCLAFSGDRLKNRIWGDTVRGA